MKSDSKYGFSQAIDVDAAVQSPLRCAFNIPGCIEPSQLHVFKQWAGLFYGNRK